MDADLSAGAIDAAACASPAVRAASSRAAARVIQLDARHLPFAVIAVGGPVAPANGAVGLDSSEAARCNARARIPRRSGSACRHRTPGRRRRAPVARSYKQAHRPHRPRRRFLDLPGLPTLPSTRRRRRAPRRRLSPRPRRRCQRGHPSRHTSGSPAADGAAARPGLTSSTSVRLPERVTRVAAPEAEQTEKDRSNDQSGTQARRDSYPLVTWYRKTGHSLRAQGLQPTWRAIPG